MEVSHMGGNSTQLLRCGPHKPGQLEPFRQQESGDDAGNTPFSNCSRAVRVVGCFCCPSLTRGLGVWVQVGGDRGACCDIYLPVCYIVVDDDDDDDDDDDAR